MQDVITDGETNTQLIKDEINEKIEFWQNIKLNKPMAHLTSLIQAYNPENPNKHFIELACKCIRRCLETGDYESLDVLLQKI